MSLLNSAILNSVASEDNQLVAGAVAVAIVLATTAAYYVFSPKGKAHEFPKLRGIQLYHAWNFYRARHDFLESNLKRNLGKSFSFNILHHNVIVLSGEDARRIVYSMDFHLTEGVKILIGGIPRVRDVSVEKDTSEEGNVSFTNKRLNRLLNNARIQDVLPTLLEDITHEADKWGNGGTDGRIDPFTEIYDLVFVMTARMTACRDLTKNGADLKKIKEQFMAIHTNTSPVSCLMPWFPGPARRSINRATTELYILLFTYVKARRHAEPTSDAIDVLIADGETDQKIAGFVMMVLFAGIVNTGIMSCWMLIDLATHPEWREKCKKEIRDLLSHHLGEALPSGTLHEKFGGLPVSAWEDELPVLDACIKESQRILMSGASIRRNHHEEVKIGEQVVRRGDFLIYSFTDVHLNPEYYPEPLKYDPGRWLRPDPVPKTIYPFIGWGAGRHPCTGMRVAKLEMKLILVLFLMRYEFELVDKDGKFPNPLPVPNRNDSLLALPTGAPCYFQFKKVEQ